MLKYELVNREMNVSRTACRVYRISAGLSLALFFGLWALLLEGSIPEVFSSILRLILLIGAFGAAITIVGMEFFLFCFDESKNPLKQIFWFCIMLIPLIGAALYCFLVYSRSEVVKRSCERARGAPA